VKTKLLAFCVLLMGLLVICGPTFAHHGSHISYEMDKPETMTGTVVGLGWQNPHIFITFDVKDASGNVVHWGAEAADNPHQMMNRGWTKDTIKAGDSITITVFPSKAGTPRGFLSKIDFNGKTIYSGGAGLPE
jgi:hypothetical protein